MIKMQLTIYMLSFFLLSCNTNQKECDFIKVRAFTHYGFGVGQLSPEDDAYLLNVYNKPEGEIIAKLPPAEEAGHIVNIVDIEKGFFKIEFEFIKETNLKSKYAWVKKGTLGLVTRNYDNKELNLYDKPNIDSSVASVLKGEQIVKVLDVCNKWAYVETISQGDTKRGWLQPDMQCGNPYTTCP